MGQPCGSASMISHVVAHAAGWAFQDGPRKAVMVTPWAMEEGRQHCTVVWWFLMNKDEVHKTIEWSRQITGKWWASQLKKTGEMDRYNEICSE